MSELKPRITENGIDYILVGDYYIPDLKLPEEHRPIGKYGRMHREYLREVHPARLNTLTLTGELWTYLADLNEQAQELTIRELTELVAKVVGYTGEIKWDPSKPDGTPRKLLDVSKLESLGYHYTTELEEGIRLTYEDFLNNPMRAER